MTHKKTTTHR